MTATFLQDDLVEELEKIFDGFKLLNVDGERVGLNFFSQNLPMPESLDLGDIPLEQLENGLADDVTESDPYPYIIVRINDGELAETDSTQIVDTMILIGIYDPDYKKQGHKDVLNIIQKIYERFAKMPVLASKYTIQYPINWTLQEEESYPYYFGGMQLKWETMPIRREDEYA